MIPPTAASHRQTGRIVFYKNSPFPKPGDKPEFSVCHSHCRGDYIAFCDQDDRWQEDKLTLLAVHCSENILLVYGRSVLIDSEDHKMPASERQFLAHLLDLVSAVDNKLFSLQLFLNLFSRRSELFHGNVLRE
jgi:glycosyltransferase involved in cell wall biosynthesis